MAFSFSSAASKAKDGGSDKPNNNTGDQKTDRSSKTDGKSNGDETTDPDPKTKKDEVFADDDEETWKQLVSVPRGQDEPRSAAELGPLLSGLATRLRDDWHTPSDDGSAGGAATAEAESYWKGLVASTGLTATEPYQTTTTTTTAKTTTTAAPAAALPEAFRSEEGKRHLAATSAFLDLSEQRAVQATMGALRSVDAAGDGNDKEAANFSSLLGTRELLAKTVAHHHKQRSARLSVLAECLRLEQDPSSSLREIVGEKLLDPLDASTESGNRKRGLFRSLVVVACRPDPIPKREALEPAKSLSGSYGAIAGGDTTADQTSRDPTATFGADLFAELVAQTSRERTQAMEGLLALFYQRLDGGIHPNDLGLLVAVLFGASSGGTRDERWHHLAGLVCAECTALWRAFEQQQERWTDHHPLLGGPGDGGGGLRELADKLAEHLSAASPANRAPLSLATLSVGLLLCLAGDEEASSASGTTLATTSDSSEQPETLRDLGNRLVHLANDTGNTFEYLREAISSLTSDALSDAPTPASHEVLYDWQLFSGQRNNRTNSPIKMLLDQGSTAALALPRSPDDDDGDSASSDKKKKRIISADVVAYTSIAREILAASIAAFSEQLLAIDRTDSCQNIGMLCQLVAVVFRNNEPLCQQFWESWESYLGGGGSDGRFPICRLMDAAYNLARESLSELVRGQTTSRDEFLGAAAPFFQLLSVLCHTPDIAETMIEMLPATMIRTALGFCATGPTGRSDAETEEAAARVLESIEGLSGIAASSASCRAALRGALETSPGDADHPSCEGPALLASLLDHGSDGRIPRHALGTIANLLREAPGEWAVLMARQFIDPAGGSGGSATSRLVPFIWTNDGSLSHAAIRVLDELVGHTSRVVFCHGGSSGDATALAFLQSVGAALLTALTGLATLRIATAAAETAEAVFRSLANFLKDLRPVLNLHPSETVRRGTSQLRDSLVQHLATSHGLGEVLVYYATAPVSMGVVLEMERAVLDQSIAERVARDDDSDAARKYGPWYSLSSDYKGHASGAGLSKARVRDFLSAMTPSDFDSEGVRARGWIESSSRPSVSLDASRSALGLLAEWASSVEAIAGTHLAGGGRFPPESLPLAGTAKDVVTRLSPQRLLGTMAPMPVQCHSDVRLSALWQSLEISTFQLLLPYLHIDTKGEKEEDNATSSSSLPAVLNLLNACLSHLKLTVPEGELATSVLLRTFVQSTRFSSLLRDIIGRGIGLAGGEGDSAALPKANEGHYLNTFLGLQILSSCVEAAPTAAHAVLGLDDKSAKPGIASRLVEGALYAKTVLDPTGSKDIFATTGSILRMRMASGCLHVLAALWRTARNLGKTSDAVGTALVNEIEGQLSKFVPDLVRLVSEYANSPDLEDRIAVSNETEFGRASTLSFLTAAMEILAHAHVYESSGDGDCGASAATFDVLAKFASSRRLLRSNNYALSVTSTKQIWDIVRHAGLQEQDPVSILSSFPAMASNLQPGDFYRRENSFDLRALARWLASIEEDRSDEELDIVRDALEKASLLRHLTTAELDLLESWKTFSEIAIFQMYRANGCVVTGSSLAILKNLTMDTLHALRENLSGGASAQTEFSAPFMNQEICAMSSCLGDLLLFQLEIGAFDLLPLDELLEIARSLTEATKSLQDVACPVPTVDAHRSDDRLEAYCKHHQTLLSCALVVCGLIEKCDGSRPDQGLQGDVYLSLCLTTCNFVRAFSRICKSTNIHQPFNITIIRSCASFFTLLVIGYQGDRSSNTSYTTMVSNAFREYEVVKLLMQYATQLSTFVEKNLSSSKDANPWKECREILDVITSVFNLLHVIADTNDPRMIGTLNVVELSQLAVRNPLFNLRSSMWSQDDPTQTQPRGYVFKREMVTLSNQKSSIIVGSEDPVYKIWLASMQVLGAGVRTSSHYWNGFGSDTVGTGFLDMSIEFLRVYRVPLLVCLKSCFNPSKMTRFALREGKVLLAMVAELCKRNVRTSFVSSNLELCEEFVKHAKLALSSMSSFLGAVGTSSELFAAIEEYESTDQDRLEDLKKAPLSRLRLSLLSIGLPMAKQKAMRLSNYASSCLEKISQEDFEAVNIIPDHLKSLSQKRAYESSSEQICRLSVTNEFSLGLVKAAAKFVSQALSLVLRTHAISRSFYVFSEADRAINCMSLVEPGIVIGYRPNNGRSMLLDGDRGGTSSGFERLRFGRVLDADTFSRTWEVEVIREEGGNDRPVPDGRRETVEASKLAGIEDKSARNPSTSLPGPAPDSMTDFESLPAYLTTGNYILILRWCHQQATFHQTGTAGGEVPSYIRQIAEQASILLGADLVLHGLTGSFRTVDKKRLSRLDDQLFELFADPADEADDLENELPAAAAAMPEGRMKAIVDASVWGGLRSQVRPFVDRARTVRRDIERRRREKRQGETEFFGGSRRKGKSSFRR